MNRLLRERLVLIVDDMPLNLLILEQVLQVAGATVVKAANGREALALLETQPVEIILTDLQMPEMDGWELAAHIRQSNKWYRQLPIIATTAETEEADKQRCFAAGINAMVYKPVDPATVYQKMEAVLMGKDEDETDTAATRLSSVGFDLSYLQEVTNGDRDCLLLIVDNLKENGPLLLIQATDAVHKCKWENVAAQLHKLKGLTALFGMHSITHTLLEAEQDAKGKNPSAAQALLSISLISDQLTNSIREISCLTQAD